MAQIKMTRTGRRSEQCEHIVRTMLFSTSVLCQNVTLLLCQNVTK